MSSPRQDSTALNPVLVLTGVILILYFARPVLIPLALALTLNFLLTPLVMWFERLRLQRIPAVALVMLIFIAAGGSVGWVVTKQLVQVANELPKYRQNIHDKIQALHFPPDNALGRASESVQEIGKELADSTAGPTNPQTDQTPAQPRAPAAKPLPVEVVAAPAYGFTHLRELLRPILVPLGTAGMVLIFTIFILIKQEDLRNRFLRLAGVAQLHAMTLALDDAAHRISRYLIMQFLVNAGYGVCFGAGLFFIGVPNALLWGVIGALLRIVPYAGALVATAFPLAMALAVFNGWGPPVLVILLFAVLELIASNFVEPLLYGAHTGISSLALLVTTVFWTMLWGWAGLILAVPLTVCMIVLGRYVPRMSFLQILLGDETALSLEAQFYQRLLALDQDDARTLVNNYLKVQPLIDFYDKVLVPALTLAEQDRHKGALNETRESFFFLSVSEIVSELAVHRPQESVRKPRRRRSRWASTTQPEIPSLNSGSAISAVRIFCLAANDQADEITSSMLAQLLERAGHGVLSLPCGSPLEEILAHLAPDPDDVICISAVPPFAFAQASSLCQRVRVQWPEIKVLAGIWGAPDDLEQAKERFGSTPPDQVVASLGQAVEQIEQWSKLAASTEPNDRTVLDRPGFFAEET
ncbi:MAG TPA: AI-2E family transporter [Candidatus Sulfotelmatobacter sp.]